MKAALLIFLLLVAVAVAVAYPRHRRPCHPGRIDCPDGGPLNVPTSTTIDG